MKMSYIIKAGLLSAVAMWIVAGVAHEIVFVSFFADATHASHQGPALIFVAYVLLASMMAYLYALLPKSDNYLIDGLKFGVFIGILWVFPHGVAIAAAHGKSLTHEVLNGAWHMVEQAIGGLVIAQVYIRQNKRAIVG